MKIKIARSFSAKIQLKQFEPVESFCAMEAEIEESEFESFSEKFDSLCRVEVEKTLTEVVAKYNLTAQRGKSKVERQEIAKEEAEHDLGAGQNDI